MPTLTGMSPSEGCVCFHLRRTARAVTQAYERALGPSGLLPTQYSLLTVLHRAGPRSLSSLADLMGMDRTTLTRNLKPLERDRLVSVGTDARSENADRRVRLVSITSAGDKIRERAHPLWVQVHSQMLQGLGSDAWRELRDQLTTTIAVAAGGASAG